MAALAHDQLIRRAVSIIKPRKNGDYTIGDVGCALITDKHNVYLGVCIDTSSGMGFCAEHSAIAAMVTAGESRIESIVAVRKDENGVAQIMAPCGRCREFIRQIDDDNLETEVILGREKVARLKDLLPYHDWRS